VAVILRPAGSEALLALAEKYETLGALRRAQTNGDPIPARAYFKALAARFPGALQELDTLPLDVIDARARDLRRAAETNHVEPWMSWLFGFHALMRAALRIRIRSLEDREPPQDRALELAREASEHAGVSVDEEFVRSVLRPPRGRIAAAVYEALSSVFGEDPSVIRSALFPRLRGDRP
jgi:hypothetical protein